MEYYTDIKRMIMETIWQHGMLHGKIYKINIIMTHMFKQNSRKKRELHQVANSGVIRMEL